MTAFWASAPSGSTPASRKTASRRKPPSTKENYAIIYITEHLAAQIPAEIERRREDVSPAVILIPGREGSLGIGTAGVHAAAEKAAGADIL